MFSPAMVHCLVNLFAKIKMFSPADLQSKHDQIKAQKMALQIPYKSSHFQYSFILHDHCQEVKTDAENILIRLKVIKTHERTISLKMCLFLSLSPQRLLEWYKVQISTQKVVYVDGLI